MDFKHTELLHKESIRLLTLQSTLLKKVLEGKGLLKEATDDQKSNLDIDRARKDIDVLEGELQKLDNLDMVLAVVGTMKSGKSTTNNAIVGLEVLPNRNRPMTAIPTLIRHTVGQKSPVLIFEKNDPINQLVMKLKEKLQANDSGSQLNKADSQEHLKNVADQIIKGYQVFQRYENEEGIFEFLKSLNDLVRLSKALDTEFPFEDFKSSNHLPVIEVEFQHLRDKNASYGRLSLLDTPGPNEEGQFALKSMMREQLSRASGVIAVLDYTQLKSESDAEVRKELLEIAEVCKGRLSIFVNKFDEKDRHSDGSKAVKELVANELFKGVIGEENVFPVSSRYAYLANRARTELALNGKLPPYETNEWIKDFAEIGLGRRWQRDIDDLEKVNDAIEALWEDSLFDLPLVNVIQKAHAQAAMLAIDSAAAKLVESSNRLSNFLGLRETALKKSAEELKENIESLRRQTQQVDELEKSSKTNIAQFEMELNEEISIVAQEAEKELSSSLETYFKHGRFIANDEKMENKKKQAQDLKEASGEKVLPGGYLVRDLLRSFAMPKDDSKYTDEQHFDPNSNEIEFTSESNAQELLDTIFTSTRQEYERVEDAMGGAIDKIHTELHNRSIKLESSATQILNELTKSMEEGGFKLKLNLPKTRPININYSKQKVLDGMLAKKSRNVTRKRRKSGAWGTICGWFGTTDYGYESYSSKEQFYKIDLNAIRNETLESAKKVFVDANASIDLNLIKPVARSCDEFFIELKNTIEEIRGDLLQGLEDGNRTKLEQEDIATQLAAIKRESLDSDYDMDQLKKESELALANPSINDMTYNLIDTGGVNDR